MSRHVAEVCGAYIYAEYRIYQCKRRHMQLPRLHAFPFFCHFAFLLLLIHIYTLFNAFLYIISDKQILFACTHICKTPTGAVYVFSLLFFPPSHICRYMFSLECTVGGGQVFLCVAASCRNMLTGCVTAGRHVWKSNLQPPAINL